MQDIFCIISNIYFASYAIYILQYIYIFCDVCKIHFASPTAKSSRHLSRQKQPGVGSQGDVKDKLLVDTN